jgi:hypothetical protein
MLFYYYISGFSPLKGEIVMKGKLWAAVAVIGVLFLASCGGGGGDDGTAAPAPSTGTLGVSLTDASTTDYKAIYITVLEVAVHRDGGGDWDVVSTPNKTYNLLDLVNGVREELGLATLVSGHYTQLRLILADQPDDSLNILSQQHDYGNYFIDQNDQSHKLNVPSGFQSGIKIVRGFDINANQTTELILDFDATKSIVEPGTNNKWLLKPTIKMLFTTEYAIIEGSAGAPGVLVSAQVYTAAAPNTEDQVTVEAATVTDANGHYKLFVEPGTYTIVGFKDGNAPYYKNTKVIATAGNVFAVNFSLTPADTGTVTGDVDIAQAGQEQWATVSIRQNATVDGNAEKIEIKSINVANGGTFTSALPVGSYSAVISTYDKTTIVQPFAVAQGVTTNLGNIDFP